jgi:hypothetical protein
MLLGSSNASASGIVSINEKGEILVTVLSAQIEDALTNKEGTETEVKIVDSKKLNLADPGVGIYEGDGKISMAVLSEGNYKEFDVSDVKGNIVEIEQRQTLPKMVISAEGGEFSLKQGIYTAKTSYPIEVDAKSSRFSLTTQKGKEFVSVLPVEAVESAVRSGFITRATEEPLTFSETKENLSYEIKGEKIFNVLNLKELKLPVTIEVSVADGRILAVDSESVVYKVFKVLFI